MNVRWERRLSPRLDDVARPEDDWQSLLVDAPPRMQIPDPPDAWRHGRAVQTDFVKRDAENRRRGEAGEGWVVELERHRHSRRLTT